MGGGYISCGSFHGADKSGSAFEGVLQGISARLAAEQRGEFQARVEEPLMRALRDGDDHILIEAVMAVELLPPLREYYKVLGTRLGNPIPWQAPGLDDEAGSDPLAAKYGSGQGWQYYCAHDLLQACEVSQASGQPIIISWD